MLHLQNRSWWAVAILVGIALLALVGCAREDEEDLGGDRRAAGKERR